MPEFPEVEAYRRTAAPLVGERIDSIDVRDPRLLRRGERKARVAGVVGGATLEGVRRIGKVLLLDLSGEHTLALGFGLRGRLVVDGGLRGTDGGRRKLEPRPEHVRLRLEAGGHELLVEDSLRMATLELDIDESRLGVDVLDLDKRRFRPLLAGSGAALKSLLMDQSRIAGIGNLVADEVLYQAGLAPSRRAGELSEGEIDALWEGLRRTRRRLLERGGSHQGVLDTHGGRERGGRCPRCGVAIRRAKVGGRTTYFCPAHQH